MFWIILVILFIAYINQQQKMNRKYTINTIIIITIIIIIIIQQSTALVFNSPSINFLGISGSTRRKMGIIYFGVDLGIISDLGITSGSGSFRELYSIPNHIMNAWGGTMRKNSPLEGSKQLAKNTFHLQRTARTNSRAWPYPSILSGFPGYFWAQSLHY